MFVGTSLARNRRARTGEEEAKKMERPPATLGRPNLVTLDFGTVHASASLVLEGVNAPTRSLGLPSPSDRRGEVCFHIVAS